MDRWVRSLRPPKTLVTPDRPIAVVHEQERRLGGGLVEVSTVFLAGSECPFSCVFCDLWRQTLASPTQPGSLPRQLECALIEVPHRSVIKLYNASNFFDPIAVPTDDDPELLRLLSGFSQVTVECHPRFIGARCFAFAERLAGRLEVAVGLETAHPEALSRLNKKMTLDDFNAATGELLARRVGVRVFVLLGCPFIAAGEQLDWTLRSVEYAARRGAGVISIIPVRGGNGALESLAADGAWSLVSLDLVEETFERALRLGLENTIVQIDLWELDRLASCGHCVNARLARLGAMNRTGVLLAQTTCTRCGVGTERNRS